MQSIIICALLVLLPALAAYKLSQIGAEFYCTFNGRLSNEKHMKDDTTNRSLVMFQFQPILIPAMSQLPAFYLVETRNGALLREEIMTTTIEGDLVFLDVFNFTTTPRVRDSKELKSITPDQLVTSSACRIFFRRIVPFVFFSCKPICRYTDQQGKHVDYCATFQCDMMTFYVPAHAPEKAESTPYLLARQGPKFPLENAPSNYACPCDKKNLKGYNCS